MIENELQSAYENLWNHQTNPAFKDLLDRGFLFQYDEDETECELLFLGINPSYKETYTNERKSYKRPISISENPPSYFKAFLEFETALKEKYNWNGKWTHFDIFAFRHTNQKYIEHVLLTKPVSEEGGISFLYDQVMIARKRILHVKPKVIVVSNALVRMFMGKERFTFENGFETGVWMDFKFEFDPSCGTDVIQEPSELKGTKVFFTSMLSGQRALDNGSKERLVWHVARELRLF